MALLRADWINHPEGNSNHAIRWIENCRYQKTITARVRDGINYYRVTIPSGLQGSCTCKEATMCHHILAVRQEWHLE